MGNERGNKYAQERDSNGEEEGDIVHFMVDEKLMDCIEEVQSLTSSSSVRETAGNLVQMSASDIQTETNALRQATRLNRYYRDDLDREATVVEYSGGDISFGSPKDIQLTPECRPGTNKILVKIHEATGLSKSASCRMCVFKSSYDLIEANRVDFMGKYDSSKHAITPHLEGDLIRKWRSIRKEIGSVYSSLSHFLRVNFIISKDLTIETMTEFPGKARHFAYEYKRMKDKREISMAQLRSNTPDGEELFDALEETVNSVSEETGVEV